MYNIDTVQQAMDKEVCVRVRKLATYAHKRMVTEMQAKVNAISKELHDLKSPMLETNGFNRAVAMYGKPRVVEMMSYAWFMRLCTLHWMDVTGQSPIRIVTPTPDKFIPEMLERARDGQIPFEAPDKHQARRADGCAAMQHNYERAFRILLFTYCNVLHDRLPVLFQEAGDYSELFAPDDLLSGGSILGYIHTSLPTGIAEIPRVLEGLSYFWQFPD